MALFGDFGKALGLGTAGEVASDVAGFLGFSPKTQQTVGGAAQAVSEAVSGIGESKPDVATAPAQAGVDSAATILNDISDWAAFAWRNGGQIATDTASRFRPYRAS